MKKFLIAIAFTSLSGCSVYMAVNAADPVEYKKVQVGLSRSEVMSILGTPKLSEYKDHQKVDTFQFVDGLNQASKGRVVLYLAGDVFTLGLAELIFWPLEAKVFDGKQCKGTINYKSDDHVANFDLFDAENKPLWNPSLAALPVNASKEP